MRTKLIFIILIGMSGLILAGNPDKPAFSNSPQNNISGQAENDTLITQEEMEKQEETDTLRTEEDYQVQKKGDEWLDTWETIKPKVKEFFSDEPGEELEYDEEKEEHRRRKRKHGFFNGAAIGWHWEYVPTDFDNLSDYGFNNMDLDKINSKIDMIGIDDQLSSRIAMRGFGGWVFLGNKIRIGGYGADGKLVANDVLESDPNISREVEFKLETGGFLIERVFHPFNNSEFYFGATLGRSKAKINIIQNTSSTSWNEVWSEEGIDDDYRVEMKSKYFSITPAVGFRYNIVHWLGLGARVGYYYGQPNEWKLNGGKLVNVPDMDFSNVIWGVNLYLGG